MTPVFSTPDAWTQKRPQADVYKYQTVVYAQRHTGLYGCPMQSANKTSSSLARIDWLNAAIQTLHEAGIAAVSIVQLANILRVTRGSFYHHFTDRDDLLRAMLNHWEKTWTVDIREEVRSLELPPGEMLLALVQSIRNHKAADYDALWKYGGYPEPYLKRDARFSRRWQSLRMDQLVREEIRDLTQIQQIDQLQILVKLLAARSARQLIYANLANEVRVTVDTIRRWVDVLQSLHLGFLVRPWFKNVSRSLRKEPKWFLRDWASIEDPGDRAETFVACHLLKAVDGWNDMGLGDFELGYLRDKEKREVDFLVARDGKPWFLVEVKQRDEKVGRALEYFQRQLDAPHAFQVVLDADYVGADCFTKPRGPLVVPAKTFLSQLF